MFARRVRYTAARYSHSPALHSWEWWNEINWTPIQDTALLPWLREMSTVLAEHDPYQRLRTTSGHGAESPVWALPEIDFMQDHVYTQNDLGPFLKGRCAAYQSAVPGKPFLFGEVGNETEAADTRRPFNWDSVHLHNGLWAGLFSGSAGTGMYWWWDLLVDKFDMWSEYKGISTFMAALNTPGTRVENHVPVGATFTGGEATAQALLGPQSVLVWVRADLLDVATLKEAFLDLPFEKQALPGWTPPWVSIEKATVRVGGLPAGTKVASVRWFDPRLGNLVADPGGSVVSAAGELQLHCPAFERDLAAIVSFQLSGASHKA
jgi:hypothetical protein